MIEEFETYDGTWPWQPRWFTGAGFRQHYIDESPTLGGPVTGTVLLLHGEPTWGYLFRLVIPRLLAAGHRVVVPDLMGFGKSETPQERSYAVTEHAATLLSFIDALDLRDITLVCHDWGGTIGSAVLTERTNRVARVVVANSAISLGIPGQDEHIAATFADARYFTWMRRLHQAGLLETVLAEFGVIGPAIMRWLQGFTASGNMTDTWLRAYTDPFATPAEARGAVAFPVSVQTGIGSSLPAPSPDAVAAARDVPAMLIYGMQDKVLLPQHFIPAFDLVWPQAAKHELSNAGHFLFEDEPEVISKLITDFIAAT